MATILAAQDGKLTPRRGQSPLAKLDNARGGPWRVVGVVAAETEADLAPAVERQRKLIEAWACELIRDFQSDQPLLSRGFGSPPIKLAWIYRAKPWEFQWPNGFINEVPTGVSVPGDLRCGFLGSQCRSVKGAKGGFRFGEGELQ